MTITITKAQIAEYRKVCHVCAYGSTDAAQGFYRRGLTAAQKEEGHVAHKAEMVAAYARRAELLADAELIAAVAEDDAHRKAEDVILTAQVQAGIDADRQRGQSAASRYVDGDERALGAGPDAR